VGESARLDTALRALAAALAAEHAVPVVANVDIDVRDLDALVRDELFGIAREAVHNAMAHADASRIDIDLRMDGCELVLAVRDDGRGIDDASLRDGREGHWGLRGMRERAAAMGGTVTIAARSAGGTEVMARLPVERAFPGRHTHIGRWWRRLVDALRQR
jgi:signal transduction histidine kinase